MKSSLVIGGNSTIGAALMEELQRRGISAHATTRRTDSEFLSLDLAAPPSSWPTLPVCDVAFLCAAITKLDACENDPAGTKLINVERTIEIARRLHAQGSFVVFLSSNHVFDGSKPFRRHDEASCPVNQYGTQKAESEKAILALGNSAVLRLTKIIASPFPLFSQWREQLRAGERLRAFTDMAVAPVPLAIAVEALIALGEAQQPGIWQLSGPRDAHYYELAVALARKLGADETLVQPSTTREAGIPASFAPTYSTYEQRLPAAIAVPDPLDLLEK